MVRMADEIAVPLLPCADIDVMEDFYTALGFRRTYRQIRPNPYVAMQREDLHLHFFGMPGFVPADSYGTCVVVVNDVAALHRAFADGLRARFDKVPLAGIPRMTRPRPRRNNDGVTGFSVVDPGGNWIRISARTAEPAAGPVGRLAGAVANAVVLADSKGDHQQAAKILDSAISKAADTDDDLADALIYRAEIAVTLGDPETAATLLTRLAGMDLTGEQLTQIAEVEAARPAPENRPAARPGPPTPAGRTE
jgi:catechol 2,3-dioxygenase-like lactoylglutathione lyase family enzyme